MSSAIFSDNFTFSIGSNEHLFVVLLFAIGGFFLIYFSKNYLNKQLQERVGILFAYTLSATVIIWSLTKIYLGTFNIQTDLPLNLCNLVALAAPILTVTKKKIYFELFFFWVMAGTLQAVFTPSLEHSFPHYDYFKYWHVHAGLVIFILYITVIYNYRPTFKSVLRSFYGIQIYLVLMLFINYYLGSNYFFLNAKPNSGSLLDYFGDWPNYIFVAELIMIPFFSLFYLPFYFARKKVLVRT
jgi:hypothetical integral membrane protein (TIGR02206 family)